MIVRVYKNRVYETNHNLFIQWTGETKQCRRKKYYFCEIINVSDIPRELIIEKMQPANWKYFNKSNKIYLNGSDKAAGWFCKDEIIRGASGLAKGLFGKRLS